MNSPGVEDVLVLFTLAGAYFLALVPMLLVYARHVGLPFLLRRFLIWAPGILFVSVAVGTLVGVFFIGRSVAAPIATGMGVLLAYAGLVPLQELLVAQGNGATRTGHLVLLSPAVLLKNALGLTFVAGSVPATTTFTWIALLVDSIGALALAVWVFLRAGRRNLGDHEPPTIVDHRRETARGDRAGADGPSESALS